MRFKIDENLPMLAVEMLRKAGHDALTVHEQQMGGEPDPRLAAVCLAEERALLTLDLDFSDIRTYPPEDYAGIIVLRPRTQGQESVLRLLEGLVMLLRTERLSGNLWILHEFSRRIREGEKKSDPDP